MELFCWGLYLTLSPNLLSKNIFYQTAGVLEPCNPHLNQSIDPKLWCDFKTPTARQGPNRWGWHRWKVRKTQEKVWACCVHTWCSVIADPEGCLETVAGVSGGDDLCFSEDDDDSDFGDFGEVSSASTAPDPPSTSTALSATYTSLHDLMRQVRKAHFIYRLRPVEAEILIFFPPNPVRRLWGIIEALTSKIGGLGRQYRTDFFP